MDLAEILQKTDPLMLLAELARREFIEFMGFVKEGYEVNWHHRRLAGILDDFVEGKIKKLMIFQPPQTGKSEMVSRGLPAYILGRKPNTKLAVCSYSAHLAESFNRACQQYMDSPKYKLCFPNVKLASLGGNDGGSKAQRNTEIFEVVGHSGFFRSVGVTGPLTGTPLDMGFIDDPFKDRIEANSQRIRDRVWDWYVEVFSTRMHNDSQECLTMTRWHEDDLAGRLLKQDAERVERGEEPEWTVVTFPGLKETEPTEFDPREIGEALWESKHSAARYRKMKLTSPGSFNALFQQRPSQEGGNIIKTEHFHRISYRDFLQMCGRRKPVFDFIVDPAYGEKTKDDPSAIMSYCEMDNCIFIRNCQSVRKELPSLCKYILEFIKNNGVRTRSVLEIEPKASGKSIVPAIRIATKFNVKEYRHPKIDGTRMDDKDKVVKANAVTDPVESGRVYIIEGAYVEGFLKQLQDFPNATHDDEADCFVMACLKVFFRKKKKVVQTRG